MSCPFNNTRVVCKLLHEQVKVWSTVARKYISQITNYNDLLLGITRIYIYTLQLSIGVALV